ncbi:MAG: hypothetical protein N6V49_08275 [Serratia symbiotica]|nr:hypothetical protein [Serratia symbiotica]
MDQISGASPRVSIVGLCPSGRALHGQLPGTTKHSPALWDSKV